VTQNDAVARLLEIQEQSLAATRRLFEAEKTIFDRDGLEGFASGAIGEIAELGGQAWHLSETVGSLALSISMNQLDDFENQVGACWQSLHQIQRAMTDMVGD
jgi:hypothetical protein